jgi:hypothetical protein
MRGSFWKATAALALVSGCVIAAGCSDDGGAGPDGGAGSTGGSGGAGGAVDAGGSDMGTVGCVTEAPTSCPNPPVKYSAVEGIFKARCVNVCHNDMTPDPNSPGNPIWGFTDYEHVSSWQDTIRAEVFACSMPPRDAGVAMTVDERRAILEFIRCGLPK